MKWTIKYWSPRYINNRISLFIWEKSHKSLPWLTQDSIKIIESLILKSDNMIEFGSGRSTPWFSNRVNKLISIETDQKWVKTVSDNITISSKVELYLLKTEDEFLSKINFIQDHTLEIALIVGKYRDLCVNYIFNKINSRGIIIIDNVIWFLFNSQTDSPNSLMSHEEMNLEWKRFYEKSKSNRRIWTINVITDTLIIFPCLWDLFITFENHLFNVFILKQYLTGSFLDFYIR